jgi:hypothetical protein
MAPQIEFISKTCISLLGWHGNQMKREGECDMARQKRSMASLIFGGLMRLILTAGLLVGAFAALSACAQKDVTHLSERRPSLVLEEFFAGDTIALGIFEDRFGNLQRQFRVNLQGTVTGNQLVLDETFLYDDGAKASRVWVIDNLGRSEDGSFRYQGRADDVEGQAEGRIAGNGLNWQYDVTLDIAGSQMNVHFDDWIYRQSEDIAINRAYVSKFGIEIGSVTIVFLRGQAAEAVGPLDVEKWIAR